jgi:hypothetical protein
VPRKFDTESDARAWLADSLDLVDEIARSFEDVDTLDAITLCRSILLAPGPLDKVALAPVVRSVHAGVARLFREGAAAGPPSMRADFLAAADQADEEAALYDLIIREIGSPAMN